MTEYTFENGKSLHNERYVYILRGNGPKISLIYGVWFAPEKAIKNILRDPFEKAPIGPDYFDNGHAYVTEDFVLSRELVCDAI